MEKRKEIIFNIDTNGKENILGEKNNTTVYADIKDFMENEGWTRIEDSIYMSEKELSTTDVTNLIDDLIQQYPYLSKCIREIHQADIADVRSLNHLFDYDGTPGEYASYEQKP